MFPGTCRHEQLREHPRRLVLCGALSLRRGRTKAALWRAALQRGTDAAPGVGQGRFPGAWVIRIYHCSDRTQTVHTTPCGGDIARVYLFGLTAGEAGLPALSRARGRQAGGAADLLGM